jgi:hypothetical protein
MGPGSPSAWWTCERDAWRSLRDRAQRLGDPAAGRDARPGRIFASAALLSEIDARVHEQIANVASLPGIVGASMAMPDAHWGYGFPIGGVAAFDPDRGGVVSAGGVGFDISCGVRTYTTGAARRRPRDPARDDRARPLPHRAGRSRRGRRRDAAHGRSRRAARRGRPLGGRARVRLRRGARADRGGRRRGRRAAREGQPARARARAARDRLPRLRETTTWSSRRSTASSSARLASAFGVARATPRLDPLRLARARPPDRRRVHGELPAPGAALRRVAARPASSRARRSVRPRARTTSARCARRSTARSRTGR